MGVDGLMCSGGESAEGAFGLPLHPMCDNTADRLAICRALSDADAAEVSDWREARCDVWRAGTTTLLPACSFGGGVQPCTAAADTYDVSNTPCWYVCFVEDGCWLLSACWDDTCQYYADCEKPVGFDFSCCVGRFLP